MELAADYLVSEMGAETHVFQGVSLLAIIEPMDIMGADPDRVIVEAITLHLEKVLVAVPVAGSEVVLDGATWEIDTVDSRGEILALGMTRYRS